VDLDTIDPPSTTWWAWNTTHNITLSYTNTLPAPVFFSLQKVYDAAWRYGMLTTLHRWTLRSRLWLVTPVSELGMRYLSDMLKKMKCHGDQFLSVTSFAVADCGYIVVCRRRCCLLKFPGHCHNWTPDSRRYKHVLVGSGKGNFLLSR
jgi:hypothetical protein